MGLETHSFPEWPAAMDVQTALAYTGVGERVLHEFGDELLAFITSTAKRRALKRREARNDMRREMIEADFSLPQTEGDA